eukprot:2454888-Pleurochrysis_carterae.AAC.1
MSSRLAVRERTAHAVRERTAQGRPPVAAAVAARSARCGGSPTRRNPQRFGATCPRRGTGRCCEQGSILHRRSVCRTSPPTPTRSCCQRDCSCCCRVRRCLSVELRRLCFETAGKPLHRKEPGTPTSLAAACLLARKFACRVNDRAESRVEGRVGARKVARESRLDTRREKRDVRACTGFTSCKKSCNRRSSCGLAAARRMNGWLIKLPALARVSALCCKHAPIRSIRSAE